MPLDDPLKIGITSLETIQKMTKLIEIADTKEDIIFILNQINSEIEECKQKIERIEQIMR